jgi:hypothetical protein
MGADILSICNVKDWLVVGWFTPDYRPIAEAFAANLAQHNAPFHLFAKPKLGGWDTLRKPSIVIEAMDTCPDKALVLMDVDCTVSGDIAPAAHIPGDVGFAMHARRVRLLWPMHKRITIKASSRVVVFRPTEGARAFAVEWERQCKKPEMGAGDDEAAMAAAYLVQRPGIAYCYLDSRYSGLATSSAVICHDSAHERMPKLGIKGTLKAVEKLFRTGRTKNAKQFGIAS